MGDAGTARDPQLATLRALRAALATRPLVNLTGPLGVGKSRLAARLSPATVLDLAGPDAAGAVRAAAAAGGTDPLVLDGADCGAALDVARGLGPVGRPVVLVSRRPVLSRPEWTLSGAVTVPLPPWPDEAIEELAAAAGIVSRPGRALAVRLAAGIPLIATAVCRALHAGASPDAPGAVADQVGGELLARLARELPGDRWRRALPRLATVRSGDETLLRAGRELFDELAGLSVVTREPLGLAVCEPYRGVLELAHQWRRPAAHHAARTGALTYRQRMAGKTADAEQRARLVEQSIALSDSALLTRTLFPSGQPGVRIRTATAADADDIGRLMHRWARHGGLDPRRADRIAEQWLRIEVSGFRLVEDDAGRLAGLSCLLEVNEHTVGGLEPLLQQHSAGLLGGRRAPRGLFLGAAYCPDAGAHALLLRYILRQATAHGRLLVCTPSPHYQRLLGDLRFRRHGAITDDFYRCGRKPVVYSNDFGPARLEDWLTRLGGAGAGPGAAGHDAGRRIGRALADLREARSLADSPLLASPRTPTAERLEAWLRESVRALAESAAPAEADAGWILQRYYFGPHRTHEQLAARLHVSRATYFRRIQHGLSVLGHWLLAD
jgi:hypothetical protein